MAKSKKKPVIRPAVTPLLWLDLAVEYIYKEEGFCEFEVVITEIGNHNCSEGSLVKDGGFIAICAIPLWER
jgi:hypothetical protein